MCDCMMCDYISIKDSWKLVLYNFSFVIEESLCVSINNTIMDFSCLWIDILQYRIGRDFEVRDDAEAAAEGGIFRIWQGHCGM